MIEAMIENEAKIYEELLYKEKELINYGATLTLVAYGIQTIMENYDNDHEISIGCYSAYHFLIDKMADCLKSIQASRELLDMELLPETPQEAAVELGKRLLEKTNKFALQ